MATKKLATQKPHFITRYLQRTHRRVLTIYAIFASFFAYFCMCGLRRPLTVVTFDSSETFGNTYLEIKTAMILSQIFGYCISKFVGIKVCSEMPRRYRALSLILLTAIAELALLVFGLCSGDWVVIPVSVNGLALGMIWGLIVSYLEGRYVSEILLAFLSCSYIVPSGIVKDFGRLALSFGIGQSWMPFVVGLPLFVFFAVFVWLLDKIPEPDTDDIAYRSQRTQMKSADRRRFVSQFRWGMLLLILICFFLTAYRDIYGQEILAELGYGDTPGVFQPPKYRLR